MNILQLCKAAERYEMLCMMNLTENEIRKAADRYEISFDDLYRFIERGVNGVNYRGTVFADLAHHKTYFVNMILLNSDFYEIWEYAVNG